MKTRSYTNLKIKASKIQIQTKAKPLGHIDNNCKLYSVTKHYDIVTISLKLVFVKLPAIPVKILTFVRNSQSFYLCASSLSLSGI